MADTPTQIETSSIAEVRADYVRDHTRNFDSYTVGRSLTSEQEIYGARFDALIAAIEARAARRERERIVAAVMELHRPIRVYDECDHDDCQADPIEVYDYMACTDSAIGWACETCCYDDEMPLENCPHGGCHNGVEWADSCPTHKLMEATDDHR